MRWDPGLLIYEIQQSSDITYRLYDWDRLGLHGQPRELHIEKGVQVANLESLPQVLHPESDLLVDGEYFQTWRHKLHDSGLVIASRTRFQSLTCIEGDVKVVANGLEVCRPQQRRNRLDTGLYPRVAF